MKIALPQGSAAVFFRVPPRIDRSVQGSWSDVADRVLIEVEEKIKAPTKNPI